MYFYRIGNFGYESHSEIIFVSKEEYSKEMFENIFLLALKEGFEQEKEEYLSSEEFLEDAREFSFKGLSYGSVYHKVVDILQKSYGFEPLIHTQNIMLWEYLPDTHCQKSPEGLEKEVVTLLNELNTEMLNKLKDILQCRSGQ